MVGFEFGVGHRAERLADSGDGGVDGAGPGAAGDALLAVDIESNAGGRDGAAAGGGEIEQLDDALAVIAGDVLGDGEQIGVGHPAAPVAEFGHASRDFGDLVVVGVDAVFLERRRDARAAGVFPQREPALAPDGLGRVGLVHLVVFERAVGVDAALVGEGVLADDGLVRRELNPRRPRDCLCEIVQFLEFERLEVVDV